MAHAGFPNGLGITEKSIVESIQKDNDDICRRLILEIDNVPVGEMNYRNMGNKTAKIGIKICNFEKQEKGYGTRFLKLFIRHLFFTLKYQKIILDTNVKNQRAQHVYQKIGFKQVGIREDSWRNQLGELQSTIDYELTSEEFID